VTDNERRFIDRRAGGTYLAAASRRGRLRLVARAHLKTKPEVGIRFATPPADLEQERTCDVVPTIARELGSEKVMFEAASPELFGWYIKNHGPEVSLPGR